MIHLYHYINNIKLKLNHGKVKVNDFVFVYNDSTKSWKSKS
jgi:hypothetical protein